MLKYYKFLLRLRFLNISSHPPLFTVLRKHHGNPHHLKTILDLAKTKKVRNYINGKDRKGYTALYIAAKNGHTECTRMLIAGGGKVNAPSGYDKYMPLMAASARGHLDIVKMLMDAGKVDRYRETAVWFMRYRPMIIPGKCRLLIQWRESL